MSNLKHQTLEELKQARVSSVKFINKLKSRIRNAKQTLSGEEAKLGWINKYIELRTPKAIITPTYMYGEEVYDQLVNEKHNSVLNGIVGEEIYNISSL